MATIGIRELKNDAPKLVRRAARGERILITRYGKPHAELGPVTRAPAERHEGHSVRMEAWERERRAFERLLPRLRRRYAGRWVAIHAGRVVGSDLDHDALFERVWKKLRHVVFFIGLVAREAPVVELPGFELT